MYCPDCGAGARDDANYCLSCGYDLTDVPGRGASTRAVTRVSPTSTGPVDEPEAPRDDARTTEVRTVRDAGRSRRGELRACPACDAPNAAHRETCGRCGADLVSGRPAPDREPAPASAPSRRRARRAASGTGRGATIAIIVVLGCALGVGLGWAVLNGPLASEPEPDVAVVPTFDPAVYAGPAQRLDVATVEASSTRPAQGDNRYDATLLFDRDDATAWNSQGAGPDDEVGEFLRFNLNGTSWVRQVLVANGYQKDDERFFGNARVKRARLEFDDGTTFDVTLLDQKGVQSLDLPEAVLTGRVALRILEAYPGSTYADVALSEVEVLGYPAVGDDAGFDPSG